MAALCVAISDKELEYIIEALTNTMYETYDSGILYDLIVRLKNELRRRHQPSDAGEGEI